MSTGDSSNLSAGLPKISVFEICLAFLKLGLTSFGGPIAHLGYFRNELVVRRKWIDEAGYADLVALCQFLPGPASSQVTFALGLLRGNGQVGGLAASLAFTLPSAIVLLAFALSSSAFTGPLAEGFLHGLKLVAVAVVGRAVWGMAKGLAPDKPRAAIALIAVAIAVCASRHAVHCVAIHTANSTIENTTTIWPHTTRLADTASGPPSVAMLPRKARNAEVSTASLSLIVEQRRRSKKYLRLAGLHAQRALLKPAAISSAG